MQQINTVSSESSILEDEQKPENRLLFVKIRVFTDEILNKYLVDSCGYQPGRE
jgi:hypothetical protein